MGPKYPQLSGPYGQALNIGLYILIASTVTRVSPEDAENKVLYLGADGEDQVEIWTNGDDNYDYRQCRDLKPGYEAVFLGDYDGTGNELPSLDPVFLVSPLPKLPAEPTKENRLNYDGVARPHLIFSADLLGRWHAADPRALERMVDRRTEYSHIEVAGEVLKTEPSELDEDDVYVYFKNASQADVRCVVKKKFPELDRLAPGTTISILGVFNANDDYVRPQVSILGGRETCGHRSGRVGSPAHNLGVLPTTLESCPQPWSPAHNWGQRSGQAIRTSP